MTTTGQALRKIQDSERGSDIPAGEHRTVWDLDAIGRRYAEAKASITARGDAPSAQDVNARWRKTEEIDVRAIKPPPASRGSGPDRASASFPQQLAARAGHVVPEPPGVPARASRGWRRWFSPRPAPAA
jgi:hypothetical protein